MLIASTQFVNANPTPLVQTIVGPQPEVLPPEVLLGLLTPPSPTPIPLVQTVMGPHPEVVARQVGLPLPTKAGSTGRRRMTAEWR